MAVTPATKTRLTRELAMIAEKPIPGVNVVPSEDNILEWIMHFDAPAEYTVPISKEKRKCPYGGRTFPVKVKFPGNYPFKAPELLFPVGMLWHPGVMPETGELCAEEIAKVYGPTKTMRDMAAFVFALLSEPHLDSPMNATAAEQIAHDVAKYEEVARSYAAKAPATA